MAKAGVKTSEFWVTLLVVGAGCGIAGLEVYREKIDALGAVAIIGAVLAAVGYTHSRATAKTTEPPK